MAKPNYSFEKRKRDMDKKAKKEEKRQRKLLKPDEPAGAGGESAEGSAEAPAEPKAE